MLIRTLCILSALSLCAAACGDDDADGGEPGGPAAGMDAPPACLDALELDCAPTFAPTFERFFENQLSSTCGGAGTGGSCHAEGGLGGLVLDDADAAHAALLDDGREGGALVLPGDPECSPLMMRLESDDPMFVMPVGGKLDEGARCAVRQWIANGAQR